MTIEQHKILQSQERLRNEYAFLLEHKDIILRSVNSNRVCINAQYKMLAALAEKGLAGIDDLKKFEMHLGKVNTYIAMAFLNAVEEHEVEFKYLTRLTKQLFKMHLNKLKILRTIKISGSFNRLHSLPAEIGHLHQLKELYIAHCAMVALPKEIGYLRRLEKLDLHHNELQFLPKEIGELKALEILQVRQNHLKDLPTELLTLPRLREVDVSDNELMKLPEGFERLVTQSSPASP